MSNCYWEPGETRVMVHCSVNDGGSANMLVALCTRDSETPYRLPGNVWHGNGSQSAADHTVLRHCSLSLSLSHSLLALNGSLSLTPSTAISSSAAVTASLLVLLLPLTVPPVEVYCSSRPAKWQSM